MSHGPLLAARAAATASHSGVAAVVMALALAGALGVLATHPVIRAWERKLGLSLLAASGVPFLLLGALFGEAGLGVLTEKVLHDLRPAFHLGLGWIGFVIGLRLDARLLERLPPTVSWVTAWHATITAIVTSVVCGATLWQLGAAPGDTMLRDVLVLAACGVTTSAVVVPKARAFASLFDGVSRLDAATALIALGAVSVIIRPEAAAVRWTLPAPAWALLLVGLGAVSGFLLWMALREADNDNEAVAFLVGGVALAAGSAGYLALAGAVVAALAGAMLANLPLPSHDRLLADVEMVERPLLLTFLVLVGAAWHPWEGAGWVLAVAFFVSRLLGTTIAAVFASRGQPDVPGQRTLIRALLPQGSTAVVIVAAAVGLYANNEPIAAGWAVHAVLMGSVLTDLFCGVVLDTPAQEPA